MPDLHPEGQDDRIEAAAEAIFHDDFKDEGGGTWESHDDGEKEVYRSNARAALAGSEARQAELEHERDALKKALREIICCNHYGAAFRDAERIARAALAGVVEPEPDGSKR